MSKSRHFEEAEYECNCGCGDSEMDSHAMVMFDMLRDVVGKPLILLSAKRCPTWNAKSGGEKNSAHLTGEAVDILVHNAAERYELAKKAFFLKFPGIGVGHGFVHVDTSKTLPRPAVWGYK